MFENLDALGILKLGFVGIAFLLAVMTYFLLIAEQKVKPHPRVNMVKMIYAFMVFSLVLAAGGFFIQIQPNKDGLRDYKTTLARLDSLIDAKVQSEIADVGRSPALVNLARRLEAEMKNAKEKGLLD